jgi:hypothetical protein
MLKSTLLPSVFPANMQLRTRRYVLILLVELVQSAEPIIFGDCR